MKRSILALASGAFILGAAEFVMMGILPQTATAMHVSIPAAGHYISAYAIGVCVGTLILVFGRKVPPKHLIILFMAIALVGNTLSAVSFCSPMLLVARFISGLPHGAFFGTATLIAKTLADKGKEAQSVSMMVMGQTVANMLGVPAGTLLAEAMSWRLAFAILAAWALMTIVVVILWVPSIDPIKDACINGQFRFLTHPGPWLILLAVFFGNSGIFCWWSYVSPWLQKTGGWSATMVPMLMVLAGLGMVVGGIVGGRLTDLWKAGATAALSHGIALCGLLLVFLLPGNHATTALLTFIIGFALFFNSSPQQLLMVQAGEGGGELIAGAAVQIAFNFGNAIGSIVGGAALTATAMNYHFTGIAGAPISLLAVILLVLALAAPMIAPYDPESLVVDETIDLEETLRDAVVLELPFTPLCEEDCLGLCPDCGFNRNLDPGHGHGEQIDPRWSQLSGLAGDTNN